MTPIRIDLEQEALAKILDALDDHNNSRLCNALSEILRTERDYQQEHGHRVAAVAIPDLGRLRDYEIKVAAEVFDTLLGNIDALEFPIGYQFCLSVFGGLVEQVSERAVTVH